MKKVFIVFVVVVGLFGCANPYQKKEHGYYGYQDKKLDEGIYHVKYSEYHFWSVSDGADHWKTRANEICGPDYEILMYKDRAEFVSESQQVGFTGAIAYSYTDRKTAAVSDGVIQCSSSPFDKETTSKILYDNGFYP